MNEDQPSREQIEARLTALLLGELPPREAELLRWTMSQDPELQKLHDQLKVTMGLVREAMHPRTGATVERETPLKLSRERREKLLEHFKTERPKELSWLKRIEIPSRYNLVIAAVVILLVCGMVAISIPNFVKARATSEQNACINDLRQIDAAKHQWALEKGMPADAVPTADDLTPYIQLNSRGEIPNVAGEQYIFGKVSEPTMAELNGKLLTASSENLQFGLASLGKSENQAVNNMQQLAALVDQWQLRNGKASGVAGAKRSKANSQISTTPPQMAQIALPNAESAQRETQANGGPEVYSQQVVGYVNVNTGISTTTFASAAPEAQPAPAPMPAPVYNNEPNIILGPLPAARTAAPQPEPETASSVGYVNASPRDVSSMLPPPALVVAPASAPESAPAQPEEQAVNSVPPASVPNDMGLVTAEGENTFSPSVHGATRLMRTSHKAIGVTPIGNAPVYVTPIPGGNAGSIPGTPAGGNYDLAPASTLPQIAVDKRLLPTPNGSFFANNTANSPIGWTNVFAASAPANQPGSSLDGETVSFGSSSIANRGFVSRYPYQVPGNSGSLAQVLAYATNGSQSVTTGFSFPDSNVVAMNEGEKPFADRLNNIGFGGGGGGVGSEQSALISREQANVPSAVTEKMLAKNISLPTQSQQQYNQKGLVNKDRIIEAPRFAKEADVPLASPPATAPVPQPEIQTRDNAFSTFSLNVSDVSFKLAEASLGNGQMPPAASIRSEEFINAFDYHDPEPLEGQPLAFVSERARDPFAQERDLLRFSVKAAALGRQEGRALNLVLLLDTSGSMERADRVAIIREALRVLAGQLQPQDTVSVVTFARTARLWADGLPGDQAGATLDKVGSITPEGGTNLEEAMRLAYETALRHFIAGGMNRVVLLTDGAANLGNVEPKALTDKVDSERRKGIALDCFGIGWEDYNDDLLEQLSSNGDGRYAFINSPDEAGTEFAAKLAGALQVAAEDVKVQVEFNPERVTAWRQVGYAKHQLTKEQFRNNSVAAGTIAAREAGNALYVIETKPDGEGPIATVRVRYRVPGTQENHERSWLVNYTDTAPALAQSSSAMRLAVTAAEFSEWLADSPFAQDVTPDELLNNLSGVPQFYGTDDRPKQLEEMIQQAKSVSGK